MYIILAILYFKKNSQVEQMVVSLMIRCIKNLKSIATKPIQIY